MFPLLALRRLGAGQRLAHHPPMHSQLARDTEHRSLAELVFPTYLFEQLHFRSPLHPAPPASSAECFGFARWAILEHRNGPFYGIEIKASSPTKHGRSCARNGRS